MKFSEKRKEKKERKERLYRPRSAGERAASRRAALYALITLAVCATLLIGAVIVILINGGEDRTEPTSPTGAPIGTTPEENTPSLEIRYTVIIDPGHGGPDTGDKITDELTESDLTVSLAEDIANILREKGCEVVFTRTADIEETLSDEKRIKNVSGDCMISLHACVDKGVYYSLLSDTTEYSGYLAEYFGTPSAESEHIITRPKSVPCVLLGVDENTEAQTVADGIMSYLERFVK